LTQLLLAILYDDRSLRDAMLVPRIHHQHQPGMLLLEQQIPRSFGDWLIQDHPDQEWCSHLAILACIHLDAVRKELSAALDPRLMLD
jgi:hypothetical protein